MPQRLPDRSVIRVTAQVVVATVWLLSGCGGPCQELSSRVCASAGPTSPICSAISRVVANPHSQDDAACVAAITYMDELKGGR